MNYDPWETCPYDPAHRFIRSRKQYHLTKCEKNNPNSNNMQCPYDARHHVDKSEYDSHVKTCPQRESVMRYKFIENEDVDYPKTLPIDSTPVAIQSENWDEDAKVTSYDPIKQTENLPVTRMLAGATKSERKKNRQQERLRMSRLEDTPTEEEASATQNNK